MKTEDKVAFAYALALIGVQIDDLKRAKEALGGIAHTLEDVVDQELAEKHYNKLTGQQTSN